MYLQETRNLLDSLKLNPVVDLDLDEVGTGLSPEEIEKTFGKFGIDLNSALAEFYLECNGIQIEWEVDLTKHSTIKKYSKADESVQGSIYIPKLHDLLEQEDSNYLKFWGAKLEDSAKDDLRNIRCIDYGNTNWVVGLMILDNMIVEHDIYYLFHDDIDFGLREKPFSEYVRTCIRYKGIHLWESIFLYGKELASHTDQNDHYLNQIFK